MQTQTDIDTDQALFRHQVELEQLYNKNQLHKRITKEFTSCQEANFTKYMEEHEIPIPFGFDLLVQMALYKRTDVSTLVGLLRRHLKDSQKTADMIMKCVEADLLDYNPDLKQFIVVFEISDDVQEELDRYQFPLPMVVPPRPVSSNRCTGYILGSGSMLLQNNHHDMDICLDHINRMNRIPFTIDTDTAKMIKNKWRNLDRRKDGETSADFNARKKAFEKYDRVSKDVIGKLTELGNTHYMTHRYDKRGRVYCMGYHVNYQGTAWNKAVIQLAEKELVE